MDSTQKYFFYFVVSGLIVGTVWYWIHSNRPANVQIYDRCMNTVEKQNKMCMDTIRRTFDSTEKMRLSHNKDCMEKITPLIHHCEALLNKGH